MKFTISDYEDLRKAEFRMPPKVFLDFWHQKEIAIIGGDPNVGKSVLINDICVAINNGASFWGEPLSEVKGHCIIVDLEQSDILCYNRIKDAPEGFFRGVTRISVEFDDEDIELSVERLIPVLTDILENRNEDTYVFIDNLTGLIGRRSTEKTAVNLVNRLKSLTATYNVSFLIVVHTIKRSPGKPVTLNDISGSKALTASVDSVFAICESIKGEGICYVKHLKSRLTSRYRETAEIELSGDPYLHFTLNGWNIEDEHLPSKRERARKFSYDNIEEVIRLSKDGFSYREIQKKTGISKSTVARIIYEYNNL